MNDWARRWGLTDPTAEAIAARPEDELGRVTAEFRGGYLVQSAHGELKAGSVPPAELPALLENLAARLFKLADPERSWRGIGRGRSEIR